MRGELTRVRPGSSSAVVDLTGECEPVVAGWRF